MTIEGIAPIVAVADPAATAAWFVDTLGFTLNSADDANAYRLVAREGAAVVLVGGADAESLAATAAHGSAYLWVADLDALWAEVAPRLAALPPDRVRAPFVQDYGMREFHVKTPDGYLVMFGESAEEA
ncbi:MAG: VOC family protein [Pseudomonadota bacterium]